MNNITRVVLGSLFIIFSSPTLLISVSSLAYERVDRSQTASKNYSRKLLVRDPFRNTPDSTRQRSVPVLRIRGQTHAKIPPGEDFQPKFNHLPDVSVTCLSASFVLRVKRSFYGFSAIAKELTLGETCKSNGVLEPQKDLLFTYELTDCQGEQKGLPDYVVYKYVLHYVPLSGRDTHLFHKVNVSVECRYERDELKPTWRTPLRKIIRSRSADFQIQLMDDSWSSPVRMAEFQLGQMVNVQVSTRHLYPGVKLFINSCYAATVNTMSQGNKYSIIDNYGCLRESRINPGASRFRMSRADNVVQFSFAAFQFTNSPNAQISLHCVLSVSGGSASSMQKLCFYSPSDRRWKSVFGQDSVCLCCDSVCNQTKTKRMHEGFVSSDQVLFSDPVMFPLSTLSSTSISPTTSTNDDVLWFDAKPAKEPQRSYTHKDFVASVTLIFSEEDHEKRQEKSHTRTVALMEEEREKMEEVHGGVEILMAVSKSFVGSDSDLMEGFEVGSMGQSGERRRPDMIKHPRYWSEKGHIEDILLDDKDSLKTSIMVTETMEKPFKMDDTQHHEVFLQSFSEEKEDSVDEKFPVGSDELVEQGLVRKLDLTQDSYEYYFPDGV